MLGQLVAADLGPWCRCCVELEWAGNGLPGFQPPPLPADGMRETSASGEQMRRAGGGTDLERQDVKEVLLK